jgi:hypothetical protein
MDKVTVMRFVNDGTSSVEGEVGGSINESINKAIDVAVQAAVVNTIQEGARKGHWSFKEEKSNELVQQKTAREDTTKTPSAPQQSGVGEDNGASKEAGSIKIEGK